MAVRGLCGKVGTGYCGFNSNDNSAYFKEFSAANTLAECHHRGDARRRVRPRHLHPRDNRQEKAAALRSQDIRATLRRASGPKAAWLGSRKLPSGDTIDDYTAGFVGWRSTWMLAEADEEECLGMPKSSRQVGGFDVVTAAVDRRARARARGAVSRLAGARAPRSRSNGVGIEGFDVLRAQGWSTSRTLTSRACPWSGRSRRG